MKRIFLLIIIVAASVAANAQTFIGYGASLNRSSAYDPSPLATGDGGKVFAGAYVEAGYQFPRSLQARVLAEYLGEPTLTNIFTTDEGIDRKAKDEFRIRPELRYSFGEGNIKPFAGAGVDYFRQRFTGQGGGILASCGGQAICYFGQLAGTRNPVAGLNPYITAGARIGPNHEASYAYLFTDRTSLNNSRLRGHRANYSYTTPKFLGPFAVKITGEADYLYYRESNGVYTDSYYERDVVFKVRVGLHYKRSYRH